MILDETRGRVHIGEGCTIASSAVLVGPLRIGARCRISHGVVIGEDGEHRSRASAGIITIGDGCTIREHVVIQRGLEGDDDRGWGTHVGSGALLMHGCHVAHDCLVGDGVTMSPSVVLGGHTVVGDWATLGIGAATHQRVTIGGLAMVGMGAVVLRDVWPCRTVVGIPARDVGENVVGLARAVSVDLDRLERHFARYSGARPPRR
jgi:UDP-N-acetylglucosamine acyltransferase